MDPGSGRSRIHGSMDRRVQGSVGAVVDYIVGIVPIVIELPRSTQLNILYFIVTDYNTLTPPCLLSVYVKSLCRTPRDYITLAVSRDTGVVTYST
jgi:hypothetical protein